MDDYYDSIFDELVNSIIVSFRWNVKELNIPMSKLYYLSERFMLLVTANIEINIKYNGENRKHVLVRLI